jgi:ATP-dependent RNA helicase RhlE
MTGEAYTFVAPEEADDLRAIERAVGKPLPRVTLPDFDYKAQPTTKLEIPIKERIAKIREQRAAERARAKVNQERRAAAAVRAPEPARAAVAEAATDKGRRRKRRRGGGGRGSGSGRSESPYAD